MAHPRSHAISSAKKFGGKPEDYQAIHDWFDATKSSFAHWKHRAARHHAEGIFWCEKEFGITIPVNSVNGIKQVPTRLIGEQHVFEDLGHIPSMKDWLTAIGDSTKVKPWMYRGVDKDVVNLTE